jgi:ferrous iron transport protein A
MIWQGGIVMPLTMIRPGETGNIKKITGKDETKRHLANLGFVVGEDVTIVSELAGNLIINVKGIRIAIDKAMANRIMI